MKEQFLHFVWRYHRFNHRNLQTIDGESIEILNYGQLNEHDGPDFLNAQVKIGDIIWNGHIEIHVHSSDWDKHKHTPNPTFKNVILHVVYIYDQPPKGLSIPTLELSGLIPKSIYDRYLSVMESPSILPCHHLISDLEPYSIKVYFHRLAVERMEIKVKQIQELLEKFQYDFEQVSFIWLSRYFGLGANSDAFQELTSQIPHTWLHKIKHEEDGIAALLLGAAGFLNQTPSDNEYVQKLKLQFDHYKVKWNIHPLEPHWWKWKMGRPASFPTLKMAQLAQLLESNISIFQLITDAKLFSEAIAKIQLHEFWHEHYLLHKSSVHQEKNISINFTERLLINVSIPIMIAYGQYVDDSIWAENAFQLLESLAPENNKITKAMVRSGLPNEHAMDSQALLHLKNEYCDYKRCLECHIGNQVIKESNYYIQEAPYSPIPVEIYI